MWVVSSSATCLLFYTVASSGDEMPPFASCRLLSFPNPTPPFSLQKPSYNDELLSFKPPPEGGEKPNEMNGSHGPFYTWGQTPTEVQVNEKMPFSLGIGALTLTTDPLTDKQTNRQTNKQTNRQTNKQTNKQTDRQTDRQTDKQTNKPFLNLLS